LTISLDPLGLFPAHESGSPNRRSATSTKRGSILRAKAGRPTRSAAKIAVPDPANVSHRRWPHEKEQIKDAVRSESDPFSLLSPVTLKKPRKRHS
jgi:hypothetical protein